MFQKLSIGNNKLFLLLVQQVAIIG